MNTPNISIIVPVYNVEKYLRPCLESILAQTYTDFEAILVDDGSTDQSGKICEEYAYKDSRFVVVHKENEGVAKARITAFEHSKGELITFIDADDFVDKHYLEKLAKPILEDDADMVSCNYFDVNDSTKVISFSKKILVGVYTGETLLDFISNHYFYDKKCKGFGITNFLCTKMVRRQYVKEGLFNSVGMWYGEDQVAVFSMLTRVNKLHIIADRLYFYVHYKEQATQKYNASLWESLIIMFEKYKSLDKYNIAGKGLRLKTWQNIRYTIFNKMAKVNLTKAVFIKHISMMRDSNYMIDFFHPLFINSGFKNNIGYWILKLRLYNLLFFLIRMKRSTL